MSTAKAKESVMDNARETIEGYAQQPVKMVQEHPIPASLVLFGIGLGIGMVIASSMPTMMHQETTTERVGRQFNDALSEIKNTIQRGFSAMR